MTCSCDQFENMTAGQKGAVTGGGSFGQVVGGGLIGGAVGYLGGSAVGDRN